MDESDEMIEEISIEYDGYDYIDYNTEIALYIEDENEQIGPNHPIYFFSICFIFFELYNNNRNIILFLRK